MKHGGGGRPGKGRRQVTEDEAELWRQLTFSVDKVKAKPRVGTHDDAHGAADASTYADGAHIATSGTPPEARRAQEARQGQRRQAAPPAGLSPPRRVPQPPLPAELDRRTLRQVAAGKVSIGDVLDLHGLHQNAAYARLRAFLVSSQAKGLKMVLVVTGKGGSAGNRAAASPSRSYRNGGDGPDPVARGVLRRSVPLWLAEPEFRAIVVGYSAAGTRHGGDGALYVRLRKAREA